MSNKPKFTLQSVQHKIVKKDILLDVLIDEKEFKDYPVGWVKIRGSEDPHYLKEITPKLLDYKDRVESLQTDVSALKEKEDIEKVQNEISEIMSELLNASVVEAIYDWDEDFFGMKFSKESATEIFNDPANNKIYNQISSYMKDRESFLPSANK